MKLPHVPAAARQPRRACASPQVRPQPTRSRAAAARQGLAGRRRRADAGRAPIGRARIRTALRVRCRGAPTTLRSHQLAAGLSSCARHCSGVASGQPAARCSGAERLWWRGCWWGCGSSAARSGVRRAAGFCVRSFGLSDGFAGALRLARSGWSTTPTGSTPMVRLATFTTFISTSACPAPLWRLGVLLQSCTGRLIYLGAEMQLQRSARCHP